MTQKVRMLLEAALALKPADRRSFVRELVQALDREAWEPAATVKKAWAAEIRRRVGVVKSGQARFVTWAQIEDRLNTIRRRGTKTRLSS